MTECQDYLPTVMIQISLDRSSNYGHHTDQIQTTKVYIMDISSIVVPSPVGPLTIFADTSGIIALDWGKGESIDGPAIDILEKAKTQLAEYFAGQRKDFDLPFNPHGTNFQKAVWQAMCDIPGGETRSYGDIAKLLNSGPRAVGNACGANPIPVLIPCHRILGANQKLGGYSGYNGTDTKKILLRLEGVLKDEG